MAERLSFQTNDTPYNSMLAAEHLGRYAIAASFCKGKRVLDIACGEGYGSAFLADSGAAFILGVDVSPEAITAAKSIFSRPAISFVVADAMDANAWNPKNEKFDVIICYETIEHVSPPEKLLSIFRQVLAPDGTILISCPNDHIDKEHGETNPFHIRPYTLEQFKELTTSVLGAADQWLLGTPLTGMSLLEVQSPFLRNDEQSIQQINRYSMIKNALLLPTQIGHCTAPQDCSYYLGIWNGQVNPHLIGAPMSRRAYLAPWYSMLFAMKERDEANQRTSKFEKRAQLFEQRAKTIRRISSFEFDRLTEKYNLLNEQHDLLKACSSDAESELNYYKRIMNNYSASRAHRLAALYSRSATAGNPIVKTFQFGKAAVFAAVRAVLRRVNHYK